MQGQFFDPQIDEILSYESIRPSAKIVPEDTYYMVEQAQTFNSNNIGFNVTSPGKGMLLNARPLIEHNLTVTGLLSGKATVTEGSSFIGTMSYICLRQCWVMARTMTHINLTINGQTLDNEPAKWVDAMNRMLWLLFIGTRLATRREMAGRADREARSGLIGGSLRPRIAGTEPDTEPDGRHMGNLG